MSLAEIASVAASPNATSCPLMKNLHLLKNLHLHQKTSISSKGGVKASTLTCRYIFFYFDYAFAIYLDVNF